MFTAPTLSVLAAAAAASSGSNAVPSPTVTNPAGVLAVLLAVLALIFWATQHKTLGKLFKVVPALVFCYFVPTTLTTLNIIPADSALYDWVKSYILPTSLLLLILALDVPAILRLGPKAIIMMLAGTAGVVVGAPISLLLTKSMLPDDIWQGMTALAGSWIGGGANFVALGKIANASDAMIAMMVIPDVFVANIWMAVLLFAAGIQHKIDRFTGADASAIRDLEHKLGDFQERVARVPSLADLIVILALGFGVSWLAYVGGRYLDGRLEAALTVDALTLTADEVDDATHRAAIRAEGRGEDRHTYLVLERASHEPSNAEAEHVDRTAAQVETVRIQIGDGGATTLADLVERVNTAAPGWSATVADGERHGDVAAYALRGLGTRGVSAEGLSLRMPDPNHPNWWSFRESFGTTTWKYILITTIGIALSFTALRNYEGAGASRIGSAMIYLLVACIGAHADFRTLLEQPPLIIMALIWMSFHVLFLLVVAWLIKAPIFFVAVGSQANIGGAASAPVVAAAFHPALAPVGALLAVAGYVLGTYAGLVCMQLLKAVAGVSA